MALPPLAKVDEDNLKKLAKLYERLSALEASSRSRDTFLDFVRFVWPGFVAGRHHHLNIEATDHQHAPEAYEV